MVNPAVVLDSGPLGLLTGKRPTPQRIACKRWFRALQAAGRRIIILEIVDYEIRRELLRMAAAASLAELNRLKSRLEYVALSTPAMLQAAALWALSRQQGQPTASNTDIDIDVILAAQAMSLPDPNYIVATTNVAHLSRFVPADLWENIPPT